MGIQNDNNNEQNNNNNNKEVKKERHDLLGENRLIEKTKILPPELEESPIFFEKHNLKARVQTVYKKKQKNWEIEAEDREMFFLKNGISPESKMKYDSMQYGPPTKITDWLYLGGDFDLNVINVEKLNFGFILNCAEECGQKIPSDVCKHKFLTVEDIHPTYQKKTFEEAFKFIEEAEEAYKTSKKVCFIHCARGRSRSVAIVIAYLMAKQKMYLKDAYLHVKQPRKRIGPHYMLKKQLILFEKDLFGKISLTYDEWNLLELEFFEKYGISY